MRGLGTSFLVRHAGTIRAALRRAWPGVGYQMEQAQWSASLRLPTGGTTDTQIQTATLPGIRAQAVLTSGTWPSPPRPGAPLPVALPVAAARQLNLTPGSGPKAAGSSFRAR